MFPQSPKISDMPTMKILVYMLDKYDLQARIVSFPDHGKITKRSR